MKKYRRASSNAWRDFLNLINTEPGFLILPIGILVVCTIGVIQLFQHGAEEKRLLPIINDVLSHVGSCNENTTIITQIQGKILIWDLDSDSLADAHFDLPDDLKGSITDTHLNVFMIINTWKIEVARYTFAKAYQQFATICVFDWPQNDIIGVATIESLEPPEKRAFSFFPEYGEIDIPIINWIESLPRTE